MAYATVNQFIEALTPSIATQISNLDAPTESSPNAVAIGNALTQASAFIDDYIGSKYALPLPSVPASLTRHCINIAAYQMDLNDPTGDRRQRYEDALRFLEQVCKGIISLRLPDASPAPASGSSAVKRSDRTFSDTSLSGYNL